MKRPTTTEEIAARFAPMSAAKRAALEAHNVAPTWPWLILFPGLAVPGALLCLYWWLS